MLVLKVYIFSKCVWCCATTDVLLYIYCCYSSETQRLIALLHSRTMEESSSPIIRFEASTTSSSLKKHKHGVSNIFILVFFVPLFTTVSSICNLVALLFTNHPSIIRSLSTLLLLYYIILLFSGC